ncbi:MAG: Hsp20/alpha crystallin family protein [Desulfobacterales bacterium]|nr:Hsp20/alpha crystallin family protein [Desulfobacterales bacterium]
MDFLPLKPFSAELSNFRKEMDRLWKRFFGDAPFAPGFLEGWAPTVDISETPKEFIVKAELAGVDPKDVEVSLSGDLLTIKGEKKKEEEDKDAEHYFAERFWGTFQRSFKLPASVQEDKIEATFKKGVLKIRLPKVAEAQHKKIQIQVK